jgi:hypothetical protein
LDFAHAEGTKQIADGIVSRKAIHAQQRLQGAIAAQQTGMREPVWSIYPP